MRRSAFSDSEIIRLLREADAGTPISQICRVAEVSPRTFYRWRQRFGGLEPAALAEVRALKMENRRLRSVLNDLVSAPSVSRSQPRPRPERAGPNPRLSREFFASLRARP